MKEDKLQALNMNPVIAKKKVSRKKSMNGKQRVEPLQPVKGCQGKGVSEYDRKEIMRFLGISEKYEKPKVASRAPMRKTLKRRDDDSNVANLASTVDSVKVEAPSLTNIKETEEEAEESSDDGDEDDDDNDGEDEREVGIANIDEHITETNTNTDDNMETDMSKTDDDVSSPTSTLLDSSTVRFSLVDSEASCGKSTELRSIAEPEGSTVIDISNDVNVNEAYEKDDDDDDDDDNAYADDVDESDDLYFNSTIDDAEYLPSSDSKTSVLRRPKTLENLETYTLGALAGFGFGCNRQEHVLYGMCLDKQCCRRALWEQTALTLKDLGRVRGKRSTSSKPSRVAELATRLVDDPRDYISPLHVAVVNCDISSIKQLCHFKGKVNDVIKPYELHQTLLHVTVLKRNLRVVETLTECFRQYLNLDPVDHNGDTPLHIGSANGDYHIVELLCDSGANPLIKNNKGKYPIELAKSHAIYQILKVESDKRSMQEEVRAIRERLRKVNKVTEEVVSPVQEMLSATDNPSTKYVFKTDKFKRTYERKKGMSLSISTKKKLDDPLYNSFILGYWKEDKEDK